MSKHESVSSEDPGKVTEMESKENDFHSPVSSEGRVEVLEAEGGMIAEDFLGEALVSELEAVVGFEASRALLEGMETEISEYQELEVLPSTCAEVYEEPESVCGRDDRVRISSTTAIPWRWNCQLIIDGGSRCTGWFIGPHTVMTAGHCVHGAGGWAKKIEVIPGMNGAIRPFGSQTATSFRSVKGWVQNKDPNYDYGAIILPNDDLGRRVGYYGFAVLSDTALKNLLVNNAGYAGDKPFGTLWFNAGRITNVTSRRLFYMIDTYGGHSGSPIWRFANGTRHAVGVHAYGGCPNKATRIVKPVFDNMLNWRK